MWNKQVSQVAAVILDQIAVLKRKFSRPRTGTDEVQGLEWGLCVTERDLFAFEIDAEYLPLRFYTIFKIKKRRW